MNVWQRMALAGFAWCVFAVVPQGATGAPPKGGAATSVTVTSATPASAYRGQTLDVPDQ